MEYLKYIMYGVIFFIGLLAFLKMLGDAKERRGYY